MSESDYLSIVVPAHNSSRTIEKCLSSIRSSIFTRYELIVVDDGSIDNTAEIARRYADRVITIPKSDTRLAVRTAGLIASKHAIIVNIDSDVEIKNDCLQIISQYFINNPKSGALTGMLAPEAVGSGFYSRYKNLYMNFIFAQLPESVNFLYGSIFALSRSTVDFLLDNLKKRTLSSVICDDTEIGQLLSSGGIKIGFEHKLEVRHHKNYNLRSLLKNDFMVPADFARLMIRFGNKPQLTLGKPVFLHATVSQVAAIMSANLIIICSFLNFLLFLFFIVIWFGFNLRFFIFIRKKSNLVFFVQSVFFTFIDQITMGLGILSGFILPNRIIKLNESLQTDSSSIADSPLSNKESADCCMNKNSN